MVKARSRLRDPGQLIAMGVLAPAKQRSSGIDVSFALPNRRGSPLPRQQRTALLGNLATEHVPSAAVQALTAEQFETAESAEIVQLTWAAARRLIEAQAAQFSPDDPPNGSRVEGRVCGTR